MSFWGEKLHRLVLVELLQTGKVRERRQQEQAFASLLELGWARRTGRNGVLALELAARPEIESTLDRAWPDWREVAHRLDEAGFPPTPVGLRELERQDRLSAVDPAHLPERMNRRTASAMLTRHAKARLGPFEQVVLEDVDVTDDGIVRMRANVGLRLVRAGTEHAAADIEELLGELTLTDRALRDGTRLWGQRPRAVLTVENLGAFQDAVVPEDVLTVYVPGWNTRIARDALSGLEDTPIIHFGDLDPNGVAILQHLRRWRPDVRWLVPGFWEEYADARGLPKRWPEVALPPDAPAWVVSLAHAGIWLEQEVIVTDSRFAIAVNEAVTAEPDASRASPRWHRAEP